MKPIDFKTHPYVKTLDGGPSTIEENMNFLYDMFKAVMGGTVYMNRKEIHIEKISKENGVITLIFTIPGEGKAEYKRKLSNVSGIRIEGRKQESVVTYYGGDLGHPGDDYERARSSTADYSETDYRPTHYRVWLGYGGDNAAFDMNDFRHGVNKCTHSPRDEFAFVTKTHFFATRLVMGIGEGVLYSPRIEKRSRKNYINFNEFKEEFENLYKSKAIIKDHIFFAHEMMSKIILLNEDSGGFGIRVENYDGDTRDHWFKKGEYFEKEIKKDEIILRYKEVWGNTDREALNYSFAVNKSNGSFCISEKEFADTIINDISKSTSGYGEYKIPEEFLDQRNRLNYIAEGMLREKGYYTGYPIYTYDKNKWIEKLPRTGYILVYSQNFIDSMKSIHSSSGDLIKEGDRVRCTGEFSGVQEGIIKFREGSIYIYKNEEEEKYSYSCGIIGLCRDLYDNSSTLELI